MLSLAAHFTESETRRVRLAAAVEQMDGFAPRIDFADVPTIGPGMALVRVQAAAVDPSDVAAALGQVPQAVWPRTPGRDFAGVVVAGPGDWVDRAVWGSGGDLGITRDGTHAGWLPLPLAALSARPSNLSAEEAGAVGVPFATAYEGLRRCGGIKPGQVVAVFGAEGRVGQAVVQIAAYAGAQVIAVQASAGPYAGHARTEVRTIEVGAGDVAAQVRALSRGHGADIVFNATGAAAFDAACRAMARQASQVLVGGGAGVVLDLERCCRELHSVLGVDAMALDCMATARMLDALRPGFESGMLKPFAIQPQNVLPLDHVETAYRRVAAGSGDRIVLKP